MSFKLDLGSTHHLLLGGPGAKGVEGWHLVDPILVVESFNPLVNAGYLIPPVDVTRSGWPIVWQPDQLRSRQEWSYGKRIIFPWVELTTLVGSIVTKSLTGW